MQNALYYQASSLHPPRRGQRLLSLTEVLGCYDKNSCSARSIDLIEFDRDFTRSVEPLVVSAEPRCIQLSLICTL